MTASEIRQLLVDLGTAAQTAPPAPGVSPTHLSKLREGAQLFATRMATAATIEWQPSHVPSSASFTTATTDFGQRLLELSPLLPWMPARQDPDGTDRALLPINDMFDVGDLIAGFVLVRPQSFYPEHAHPPQELYLAVDGTADWRYGGSESWTAVDAGSVFYNPPAVQHGQRNGDLTNISLYVLWPD